MGLFRIQPLDNLVRVGDGQARHGLRAGFPIRALVAMVGVVGEEAGKGGGGKAFPAAGHGAENQPGGGKQDEGRKDYGGGDHGHDCGAGAGL